MASMWKHEACVVGVLVGLGMGAREAEAVDLTIRSGGVLGTTSGQWATSSQPTNVHFVDVQLGARATFSADGGGGQTGGGYGPEGPGTTPRIAHSQIRFDASVQRPSASEVVLRITGSGYASFDNPSDYVGSVQSNLQLYDDNRGNAGIEIEVTGNVVHRFSITENGGPFTSVSLSPSSTGGGTISGSTLSAGRYVLRGNGAISATHEPGERNRTFGGTLTLRVFDCAEAPAVWGRAYGVAAPPPGRLFGSLVERGGTGRMMLFGGISSTCATPSVTEWHDDAWEWNGDRWTRLEAPGAWPSGRYSPGMAEDPVHGRVVVVGGMGVGFQPIRDVWVWQNGWAQQATDLTPTGGRFGHRVVFDPVRSRMVLFGGDANGNPNDSIYANDVWDWNGELAQAWVERPATATRPPGRKDGVLVFDRNRSMVLLYGGYADDGVIPPDFGTRINPRTFGDVWSWNGTSWTRLPDPPSGMRSRHLAHAFYDSVRGVTVISGGQHVSSGVYQDLDDTWQFDGVNWALVNTPATFGSRFGGAAAFDGSRGVGMLFSGNGCPRGDTWLWRSPITLADRRGEDDGAVTTMEQGQTLVIDAPTGVPGNTSYRWSKDGLALGDGGRVSGAGTTTLRITGITLADEGVYAARLTQTCGEVMGPPVRVEVATCPADLDDGTGAGTPDGGVNIDDLVYFVTQFAAGEIGADLDDDGDPGVGVPDGGVTIEDLLFFLAHLAEGC